MCLSPSIGKRAGCCLVDSLRRSRGNTVGYTSRPVPFFINRHLVLCNDGDMHVIEHNALARRRSQLSAEKQHLLKQRLRGQSVEVDQVVELADSWTHRLSLAPDVEQLHEPFVLTELQRTCWVGQSDYDALNTIYGQFYLELDGLGIDFDRVQCVLNDLIRRHPMLRAVVDADGRQRVLAHVPLYHIPIVDLRGVHSEEAAQRMLVLREELEEQGPITEHWPLFDLRAHLLDGGHVRLHFRMSLVLFDGWSVMRFIQEFLQCYHTPDIPLEPIDISFRDYVLAVHALQESWMYQRAYAYWAQRFATLPPAPLLSLVQDLRSIVRPRFVRRCARIALPIWQQLQDRATQEGLTANVLLCAVYAEVLTAHSRSAHYTITLLLANRLPFHPHVDHLIGNCSNTLVLEVDHRTPAAFVSHARQLQTQLWNDLDHSVVSGLAVRREQARVQGHDVAVAMPVTFDSVLGLSRSRETLSHALAHETYSRIHMPQVCLGYQATEDIVTGDLVLAWEALEEVFPLGLIDAMFANYQQMLLELAHDTGAWQQSPQALMAAGCLV